MLASAFVDFVKVAFCVSMSLNALEIVKYKIITAVLPQHVSPFVIPSPCSSVVC